MRTLGMTRNPYIPALTGLRYFAALGVLWCHFSTLLPSSLVLQSLAELGGHGVGLFFVLSGFVIAHNLTLTVNPSLGRFYLQRLTRILPLTWLMLFTVSLAYQLLGSHLALMGGYQVDPQWVWSSWVVNALCLQAWVPDFQTQQYWNAPAWSISAELFFYALAPLLVLRLKTLRPITLLGSTFVATLVIWALYWRLAPQWLHDPFILDFFPIRLPLFGLLAFIYGIGFYRLHQTQEAQNHSVQIIGLLALLVASYVLKNAWGASTPFGVGFYYFSTLPLFGVLIYRVSSDTSVIARFLSSPWLQSLGNASFALYLMHWLVLEFAIDLKIPFGFWHWVALVISLSGASVALHLWFEKPARQWLLSYFDKEQQVTGR